MGAAWNRHALTMKELVQDEGSRSQREDVAQPPELSPGSLSLPPLGTWSPTLCPPGTFTPQDVSGLQEKHDCSICPPGHYCRSVSTHCLGKLQPPAASCLFCPRPRTMGGGEKTCSPNPGVTQHGPRPGTHSEPDATRTSGLWTGKPPKSCVRHMPLFSQDPVEVVSGRVAPFHAAVILLPSRSSSTEKMTAEFPPALSHHWEVHLKV